VSATTAVLAGRRAAEALMVDACTIRRQSGEATDPDTGQITRTYTVVYSGRCRIQQRALESQGSDVGEARVYQVPYELQLPMSVTGPAVEDVVTCDTSALDADLPGRQWWIRGLAGGTHKTARRIQIEEVTG
jgi:hypothetical protein